MSPNIGMASLGDGRVGHDEQTQPEHLHGHPTPATPFIESEVIKSWLLSVMPR